MKYVTFNKNRDDKPQWRKISGEKAWKMGNFSLPDFHLKSQISPFFKTTMDIFIYIVVDLNTSTLGQCKNIKIVNLSIFQWLNISKILPLPPSKLYKIGRNFIYFLNGMILEGQVFFYFIVSINYHRKNTIQLSF